jgi:hypothetical protein
MAREVAAINKTDEEGAIKQIETQLAKSPKRLPKNADEEGSEAVEDDGADLQEKAA